LKPHLNLNLDGNLDLDHNLDLKLRSSIKCSSMTLPMQTYRAGKFLAVGWLNPCRRAD